MSIIYDFKSINANLQDDKWYEPKVEWRLIKEAEPELDTFEAWSAERERRRTDKTTKFTCDWCFDLGFPDPCATCGKVYS